MRLIRVGISNSIYSEQTKEYMRDAYVYTDGDTILGLLSCDCCTHTFLRTYRHCSKTKKKKAKKKKALKLNK